MQIVPDAPTRCLQAQTSSACPQHGVKSHTPLFDELQLQTSVQSFATRLDPVKVATGWHLGLPQATPAGQHVRLATVPQLVVPDGQPQTPFVLSMQATPLAQHVGPQGVVPEGQQQFVDGWVQVPVQHELGPVPQRTWPLGQLQVSVDGLTHVSPAPQHVSPHAAWPDGHTASARKGLSTVAAAAARAAPPNTFSTPRRLWGSAIALDRSSNRSLMGPPESPSGPCLSLPGGAEETFSGGRPPSGPPSGPCS
jgi:hypothetical protein